MIVKILNVLETVTEFQTAGFFLVQFRSSMSTKNPLYINLNKNKNLKLIRLLVFTVEHFNRLSTSNYSKLIFLFSSFSTRFQSQLHQDPVSQHGIEKQYKIY